MQDVRETFERITGSADEPFLNAQGLIRHFRYNSNNLSDYGLRLAEELEAAGRVRTARAYRSAVKRLSAFIGKQGIPFTSITCSLMEAFERQLREDGRSPNTISFYMRNLRAIYRKAIEEGLVEEGRKNPFRHVFTGVYKTQKRALDASQMQRLQNLDYNLWLEQGVCPVQTRPSAMYTSWRLFTFCFHARGMSFVDLAYLKKENITNGVIRYYRKKTGGLIEVRVTSLMQDIIDSFAKETVNSPYVFPIITRQDKYTRLQYENALYLQNRRLKKLAKEAGINMALSTHVSRHSWASIAKSRDTPLWVISEGLGHSSEKVTYTDLSRLDRANEEVCALVKRIGSPGTHAAF
ncbi:tyrosine-type recombinase/integrase [Dysgonomonas hofstadii]|nr:site-specific integrase [Dysgonomonas hofstadii]